MKETLKPPKSVVLAPPGSKWVHHKGGQYQVIAVGYIEADLTPAVIYTDGGLVWVRPAAEFLDGRFRRLDADGMIVPTAAPATHV